MSKWKIVFRIKSPPSLKLRRDSRRPFFSLARRA
jgi:hypothetical protein